MGAHIDGSILVCLPSIHKENKSFPMSRWREAINAFLDGVWTQNNETAEGSILFSDTVLILRKKEYRIIYPGHISTLERPNLDRNQIHAVTSERSQLELGLARFVRNDRKRMLAIEFPTTRLMLWKGKARSDFVFTAIPRTF